MKEKYRNIDDLFKDKLGKYAPEPPSDIWAGINPDPGQRKYGFALYFRIAAAVVLIATGIGFALWLTNKNNHVDQDQVAINNDQGIPPENILVKDNVNTNENIENKANEKDLNFLGNDNVTNTAKTLTVDNQSNSTDNAGFNSEYVDTKTLIVERSENNRIREGNTFSIDRKEILLASLDGKYIGQLDNSVYFNIVSSDMEEGGYNEPGKSGNSFWHRFSVGAHISPTLTYRTTESNQVGIGESPLSTFSGGVYIESRVSKRWHVKTGFYYYQFGKNQRYLYMQNIFNGFSASASKKILAPGISREENTEAANIIHDNSIGSIIFYDNIRVQQDNQQSDEESFYEANIAYDVSLSNNIANQYSTSEISDISSQERSLDRIEVPLYYQKFVSFEIPLIVKYTILDKNKFALNIISGINANFVTKAYVYNSQNNNIIGETGGVSLFNFTGNLAIGLELPVTSNIKMAVEPTFKCFMNSINTSTENVNYVKTYPYSFGVYTGFRYMF